MASVSWALWLSGLGLAAGCGSGEVQPVRPPACAGSWYPADKAELAELIDRLVAEASPPKLPRRPIALIVPHAGLRYSGAVAACAYKALRGRRYERVIVLAISHRLSRLYRGASVPDFSAYQTPLGQVPVDQQACQALRKDGLFRSIAEAHRQEHSVEIQLPFLQRLLRQFKLVPVLVGQCQMSDYEAMARALLQIVDEQTLLVASSDFTHYGAGYGYVPFHDDVERRLTELADGAIRPILACDLMGFDRHVRQTGDTICGQNAIRLLLRVLQLLGGADGVLMGRDMSGRMTGSFDQSVTYVAVALMATQQKRAAPTMPATTRPAGRFSPQERRTLLRLARQAVTVFLREGRRIDPRSGAFELTPKLLQPGAAFVTLRRDGRLRGCIGETVARRPLVDSVVDNAINAATRDRRFIDQPVRLDELPAIRFEVSVLSPLQRVASAEQIVLGRDGVVLERAGRRALFLPQVADETGWSKELFLSRLAMKAGLPPGAWRQPGTVFYTFTAEVFAEAGQQAPAEPVER